MSNLYYPATFLTLLPVTLVQYVSGEKRPDGLVLTGDLLVAKYAICYLSNNVIARSFAYFLVFPRSKQ